MPADPTLRGLTFGSASVAYERFRPGYPAAVADLALTGLDPGRSQALEVGAGTGKATRLLAARGVHVTAVEPDAQMRAVLATTVTGLPVTVLGCTFETLPADVASRPVDLLYAAAAWHWTDPRTRWERAARLLRTGGVFASFGGPLDLADPQLHEAVSRIRLDVMESDAVPEPWVRATAGGFEWPGNDLADSPWFTDVEQHDLTTSTTMTSDDFVGLLSTISAYLAVAPDRRADVLRRIRAALPETVEVRRDLVVHRAVRSSLPAPAR